MTHEELKIKISSLLPTAVYEENEFLSVMADAAEWKSLARHLFYDDDLQFDFLSFVTCIDWKTHLTVVYHLDSYKYCHNLIVKIKLEIKNPEVTTVSHIWQTANFHERETHELFGVNFQGHPDLRLLILQDGWEGKNPLRKDFEDPVNMIRL